MQVTGLGMKKAHGADSLLGFHCHKQLDVRAYGPQVWKKRVDR